jgi:hypothetical protein
MYEKPKLVLVGEVETVVRGYLPNGGDFDLNWGLADSDLAEEEE